MDSVSRRGGTKQIRIQKRSGDPGGVANQVQIYAKGDGSGTQLYAQDGSGIVHPLLHQPLPGQFAQGDYIRAEISTNQTGPIANDDVEFDSIDQSRGSLTLDTATGIISGLKANRTWKISWVAATNANADDEAIRSTVYNHTEGSFVGNDALSVSRSENSSNASSPGQYIFTPSVDTSISIRVKAIGGTPDVESTLTWVIVEEVGATAPTAQGNKITVNTSTNTSVNTNNAPVAFDQVVENRGSLGLSSNAVTGLQAGHTYLLLAHLDLLETSDSFFRRTFAFYDTVASSTIGAAFDLYSFGKPKGSDGSSNQGTPYHIFIPTQDTSVELRMIAQEGDTTVDTRSDTRMDVVEIGTAAPAVIGGLEFLDRIEVTGSDVTSVTFSSSGDGDRQHDINGDVDEEYFCRFKIIKGGATNPIIDLEPNGSSSDLEIQYTTASGGTLNTSSQPTLRLSGPNSSSEEYHGTFRFRAKSGSPRHYSAESVMVDTSAFNVDFSTFSGGAWNPSPSSTNVTSLDIVASVASGIGVGSTFELYRVTAKTTENYLKLEDTKTAAYTVKPTDQYVPYDTSGGAFSITLFSGGASNKGQAIRFKNKSDSTNQLTLTAAAGQTIDEQSTLALTGERESVMLVFDGVSDWEVN